MTEMTDLTRARKQHRCGFCNQAILPGELYVSQTVKPWDSYNEGGGFDTWRACRFCDQHFAKHIWDGDPWYEGYDSEFVECVAENYEDRLRAAGITGGGVGETHRRRGWVRSEYVDAAVDAWRRSLPKTDNLSPSPGDNSSTRYT